MSTLAKVFIIINLILSIVFITVAGTLFHHQQDWREAFEILTTTTTTSTRHMMARTAWTTS